MRIVDANIILRYILEDNETQFKQAEQIIDGNKINIPTEVLCEVVFVLEKVYKVNRTEICDTLTDFINDTDSILPYYNVIILALKYYAEKKLDFVDCILAGYAKSENADIITFDKALQKLIKAEAD